jgi:hypothetical protein
VDPELPLDKIKRIAFMDFGHKRKNFKGNLKRSILAGTDMTADEAVQKLPHLASFADQDLEVYIRGWFTDNAKVRS